MNLVNKVARLVSRPLVLILALFGYRLQEVRFDKPPSELSPSVLRIADLVHSRILTHSSKLRLYASALAIDYCHRNQIDGAFVECGVWKGGNAIVAKAAAESLEDTREFVLFDTYTGHLPPGPLDVSLEDGSLARHKFDRITRSEGAWAAVSTAEVVANFSSLGVSVDHVKFVEGDMLKTLYVARNIPEKIAVLRLDTDWYEPTKAQLEVLWKRLVIGGVLLLDDYGHWSGSKKAVDDFFDSIGTRPFLTFTDWSGRAAVKLS